MRQSKYSALVTLSLFLITSPAFAHKLHKAGIATAVADSLLTVTPSRDWNQLSMKRGKNTETWTLDGEQLNDLTFFAGIEPGNPIVKEKNKTRQPLPKFSNTTLLAEIPELYERTSRSYKGLASFRIKSVDPTRFIGHDGVFFTYEFADEDQLTRSGEARAAIVGGKLYMITFEAPRLSYYQKVKPAARAIVDTAVLR